MAAPKRDFFGRIVDELAHDFAKADKTGQDKKSGGQDTSEKGGGNIFVSFHEGYSNAVRKPISLDDLLRSL